MLGLVSNSDGRAEAVADAVNLFVAGGVEMVIHCGDIGGRHVLDALAPIDCGFVWGDRDKDKMILLRHGQRLGLLCWGQFGELEYAGKRIAILHGDDKKILRRVLDEQQYDYVLCGHSIEIEDRTVGKTRLINPGSLHGAPTRSAAIFDPDSGKLSIVPL